MKDIVETRMGRMNGFVALLVELAVGGAATWLISAGVPALEQGGGSGMLAASIVLWLAFILAMPGFFIVHPNEAKVFVFFGNYAGSAREPGFSWTNPLAQRKAVSLRVRNFASEAVKVNDEAGNPIEIAAVVVWHVTDSAKALFNVEDFENFVAIQSETAIRNLATTHPYDAGEQSDPAKMLSLRGNPEEIAAELNRHLTDRLQPAGVTVVEARLSHLAYAPEIAQAMLRRQQAAAVISARRLIVDGAVGMVRLALQSLEESGVVKLDEERKAAMVNNLLVALVSESDAQPVINTGTLYS